MANPFGDLIENGVVNTTLDMGLDAATGRKVTVLGWILGVVGFVLSILALDGLEKLAVKVIPRGWLAEGQRAFYAGADSAWWVHHQVGVLSAALAFGVIVLVASLLHDWNARRA